MIVELTLITVTTEKDGAGFRKEKRHELNVIAEKKSVKRTEFYSAMKSNIIPKFTFEVYAEEYEATKQEDEEGIHYATKAICDNEEYDIIRTYTADDFRLEIVTR